MPRSPGSSSQTIMICLSRVIDATVAIEPNAKRSRLQRCLECEHLSRTDDKFLELAVNGGNPRTGEKIKIAASKQPKFKPGKRLRDELN